jgi:hypothetical protein
MRSIPANIGRLEGGPAKFIPAFLLLVGAAWAGEATDPPLSVKANLRFHAKQTASLGFVVEMAAYAGVLHWMDTPREWGQGASPYGKRVASAAGATAIRNVFAFALDSALREDPRYRRSGHGNFFVRIGHAARETFVTRTDGGRRRFAIWRFGSALGAACLSNAWDPGRLNTFSSGMGHHRPGPAGRHRQRVLAGCEAQAPSPSLTAG